MVRRRLSRPEKTFKHDHSDQTSHPGVPPGRRCSRGHGCGGSAPGLSGLQISPPPADLVTSERLKGVRFDLAEPRGYYTEQVDTLVKLLTSSLSWHEEALNQRDQGIHVLQTHLDTAAQQEAALRAQIEVLRHHDSVTTGQDGHGGRGGHGRRRSCRSLR